MKNFLILYKVICAITTMATTMTGNTMAKTTSGTTMDTTLTSTTSQEFTTITPDTFSGAFSRNPLAREDDFGEDFVEGSATVTTPYMTQTTTFSGLFGGFTDETTTVLLETTTYETSTTRTGSTGTAGTGGTSTTETGGTGTTGTGTPGTGSTGTAPTWASTEAASSASSFTIFSTFEKSSGTSSSAGDNTDSKTTSATTTKESKEDITSTESTTAPSPPKAIPRDDVIFDSKFNLSGTTLSGIESELETTTYVSESTTEHESVAVTSTQEDTGTTTAYETTSFETTSQETTEAMITETDPLVGALPGVNVEPIPAPNQAEEKFETLPTTPNTATSHSIKNEKVTIANDKPTDEELNVVTATKPLYVCTTGASVDDVDCEENVIAEVEDKESEFIEVNRKCKFYRSTNSH